MIKKGFSLIEVLVTVAIIAIGLVALGSLAGNMIKALGQDTLTQKASYYAQEGIELVRILRDESWLNNIAIRAEGTTYYLVFSGGQWELISTDPGLIEGIFRRTVRFNDVYRDANEDIVQSGGTLDSNTKEVLLTVSWGGQSVELTTYLTNFAGEQEAIAVEFDQGTTDADLATFPNNSGFGDPAQSFATTTNFIAAKVEVFIKKATADPSDIYAELRSGGPRGTVLATSQTIDSSSLPEDLSWITFTFSDPPSLVSGTTYWLRLRSVPDSAVAFSGAEPLIHWGYEFPGTYGDGAAYRYITSSGEQLLDSYDFSFRVYKSIQ